MTSVVIVLLYTVTLNCIQILTRASERFLKFLKKLHFQVDRRYSFKSAFEMCLEEKLTIWFLAEWEALL